MDGLVTDLVAVVAGRLASEAVLADKLSVETLVADDLLADVLVVGGALGLFGLDVGLGLLLNGDGLSNNLGRGSSLVFSLLRSGLGLLTLGEADNTAGDGLSHADTLALLTALDAWVLSHVVVVTALVDDHGAAEDGVGSGKHGEGVTVLVFSVSVPTAHDHLEITDTAVMHVEVRMAPRGTEWVEDGSDAAAAVLEVTVLVDLEAVLARSDSFEFSHDGNEVIWGLGKSDTAV